MKCSLHRLLVSSAIALPFSSFSLFSADTPLGSADSYSGSGNTVQFTPKDTNEAGGTTYSCTGDMSIYNAGNTGGGLATACFQEQSGDLTFIGNGYSMSFNTIDVQASNPGAINVKGSDKTLTLQEFSQLSFIASPSSATSDGTGAIESKGNIVLKDNEYVTFINNNSTTTGGAACSQGNCTISGNQIVRFDSNSTASSNINGGAICCSSTPPSQPSPPAPALTIQENNEVSFINNTASGSGGAIYAQNLVLSSQGKGVLFANNTSAAQASPKGGAIAIADSGTISLSADGGNITFNGNITKTTGSGATTRNAIDLGSQAKFTVLRATEGNSIYFYDPITGDSAASSGDLNINNPESSATYGGSIVFSGEKLSETEKQQSSGANLKSTFKQPVSLKGGSLVLKDGVTVDTNTFTQTAGTLLMDAGTTLSASTGAVTVNNLAVNMSSLNGTDKVTLSATASNQNVTLSGPITLMDENGNAYENPDLRNSQSYDFIVLSAGDTSGAGTATPPSSNNTDPQITEQTPQHYGYQGTWAVKWVQGTGTGGVGVSPQTATLSWAKTGYIPNPQKRGNLVPNSLWGVFVDVRSIQEVMKRSSDSLNEGRGIWASAIGNFFHRDNINKGSEIQQGFRHRSAGYIIGASTPTIEDNVLNLAFCQLFGRDKDRLVTKNHITSYAGSINFQHEGRLDYITNLLPQGSYSAWGPIALMLNAQLTYCHSSNDMKTSYTQPTPQEVKSSWGNDGFGMEIGGLVSIPTQHFRWFSSYSPFVKVQLTYAHQEDFKESGEAARSFETSDLFNFGMPIGIKLEKSMGLSSYDLSIAYVPDLIRSNPDCTTTLIISGDSWQTFGTNLARNALLIRAGNYFTFSDTWEMFSQFAFELRSSSRSYSVDLGSKIRF
ncbi:polymorphic outer membrane protein [Chlamydia pecorum]|uniref:polymorphic outer membrane protein middle domain-containing protein n=1 Tax=Chlamydia pecorum TaxID=85991 RepID=UPI001CF6309B|nr:polymorphic outer membrane protein middle domain-containing protein [Chlamydia pecorum]UBV33063.1 polymorphic outer membrane protein [Chlamydia pecorum]